MNDMSSEEFVKGMIAAIHSAGRAACEVMEHKFLEHLTQTTYTEEVRYTPITYPVRIVKQAWTADPFFKNQVVDANGLMVALFPCLEDAERAVEALNAMGGLGWDHLQDSRLAGERCKTELVTQAKIVEWLRGCGLWAQGLADLIEEGKWRTT